MNPAQIAEFIQVIEGPKIGDYREFQVVCPYFENGKGSQFTGTVRVSGTEEVLIETAGVNEKVARKVRSHSQHLAKYAEESGKVFEVRGKQLWLVTKSDA